MVDEVVADEGATNELVAWSSFLALWAVVYVSWRVGVLVDWCGLGVGVGNETGINETPLVLFAFCVGMLVCGCYTALWYTSHVTDSSKVLLWRSIKLNIPISDLKKFVKLLHNSGCLTANYQAARMETRTTKVIEASFLDTSLLHWMGEYPMLTITVRPSLSRPPHSDLRLIGV